MRAAVFRHGSAAGNEARGLDAGHGSGGLQDKGLRLDTFGLFRKRGIFQQLRKGVEKAVADAGLSAYFQLRGRDCNMVYVARDGAGQPSQEFRTLVLQELLERGILAPSFVVSAAHDSAAIDQTVTAVADLMPVYRKALDRGIETVVAGRPVRPAIRPRG